MHSTTTLLRKKNSVFYKTFILFTHLEKGYEYNFLIQASSKIYTKCENSKIIERCTTGFDNVLNEVKIIK